ncbi:PREDICTED: uncharacterized protein LOC106925684 isoform X1 [Poecilia mexicana]|uniref:uncharacterized protein LOC106925684 isoform X1 n=1 Tax=Poecilia mexicana TaxID=48701 RepID=UPI00072E4714|nr:PREDICTED: uncharacterized protein LOC106925684 isoform X1 [Poecilia mexicana]
MMEGGVWRRKWKPIAAVLLLCSLVLGLTFFSWRELTKALKVGRSSEVENATFSGKEFESAPSVAVGPKMGLNDSSIQADTNEAGVTTGDEWSTANSSLHCGPSKMKFKVMGLGAAELQLDIGNSEYVPLTQVPEACGVLVNQTKLGLVLLVHYDSCTVLQENGTYIFTMRWRGSGINLTCTMFPISEVNTTEPHLPLKDDLPHDSLSLHRLRRHLRWRPMYFPCSPHKRYPLCLYTPPPPTTTTSPPPTTTTTVTARPIYKNPYFWKRLLALYPLYSRYLKEQAHPLQSYYHAYRRPVWQMYPQAAPKPQVANHPFYQFFMDYFTTTMPTTTANMPSSYCPYARRTGPFDRLFFAPRMSFGHHEMPDDQQNVSPQISSGYQSPENPDSFWESFPLLYHTASQDDPYLDWEDMTPR